MPRRVCSIPVLIDPFKMNMEESAWGHEQPKPAINFDVRLAALTVSACATLDDGGCGMVPWDATGRARLYLCLS